MIYTIFSCIRTRLISFASTLVITGCQWPLPSSEHIVTVPGDSRVVYITDSKARGNTITCVEPSRKSDDSFKDFTETVLDATTEYHNPDRFRANIDDARDLPSLSHERKSTITSTFENNRATRFHNMRELLFEVCQARANGLISDIAYERLLIRIIDRTAALHAMEVLLHELDSKPLDKEARRQLIHLTAQILNVGSPIDSHDGEQD